MKPSRKEVLMTVYTNVEGVTHIKNLPYHQLCSEGEIRIGLVPTKDKKIAIHVPIDALCSYNKEETKATLLLDELLVNNYEN